MTANILDGKLVAAAVLHRAKAQAEDYFAQTNQRPGLTAIVVGDDPASQVYVGKKERTCRENGLQGAVCRLPADITERDLLAQIETQNRDPSVHGILVQLPLPKHISLEKVVRAVDPLKDVDGFHPENLGLLIRGQARYVPCTPQGVQELLMHYQLTTRGKEVVIVGRSDIVGKPMAMLMMQRGEYADATVTVCHTQTRNMAEVTRRAEVLIVAAGQPRLITGDMVQEGAIVVDVGIHRADTGLVGDVDFESVSAKASWITKVPGGVGPMTVAMLIANTVQAAQNLRQSAVSARPAT